MFVLPKIPSFGEEISRGLGAALGQGATSSIEALIGKKQQSKENEALKRLTGQDFSGMSPDMKKEFVKIFTGARSQKEQEKHQMLETGLGTIAEMRDLIKSTGPSNWFQGLLPGETQKNRAQFAQLGKSLIPLVSAGVSIRNQKEFDEYKKVLTDPNAQQSKIEGALDGLENLLARQTHQEEEKEEKITSSKGSSEKMTKQRPVFDSSNPFHKKVRDALLKKYKNDREKVAKELARNFQEE